MNFCKTCGNMLYMSIRVEEGGGGDGGGARPRITSSCKSCGSSSELDKQQCTAAMFSTNYGDDQMAYKQFMTPHITHDPTLPHASDIECINPNCGRPEDKPRDVIYVKYDRDNLKYMYHCTHCKEFWKSG